MKEISNENLLSLVGGWADNKMCADVQIVAASLEMHPEEATEKDWDKWCKAFDKFCLGIDTDI